MLNVKKILFIVIAHEIVRSIIYLQRQSYKFSNQKSTVNDKYMSRALKQTESERYLDVRKKKTQSLQNQVAH